MPRLCHILVVLLASAATFGSEDVAYIVNPPELRLTDDDAKKTQVFNLCEIVPQTPCGESMKLKVVGPITRESALALLRAVGKRDGPISRIASDGKVAKVFWSTEGGGSDEVWELQNDAWSLVWTYQTPY
jgi:hypothetical protein